MATAQIMQEELQQSVLLSEEDADFEEDVADTAMDIDGSAPADTTNTSAPEGSGQQVQEKDTENASEEDGEGDADGDADGDIAAEQNEEGDLDEIPEDEDDAEQDDEESESELGDVQDDEEAFDDEDADGEDEEVIDAPKDDTNAEASDIEDEEEDDDENEGVGAVKIKPGETDESESESEDDVSLASGGSSDHSDHSDRESVAEWDEVVEHEREEDDEEDDESEAAANNCVFCKKPEEEDPAEEFESYLTCKGCGEHAHQQCARDAKTLDDGLAASQWKCPECGGRDGDSESEVDAADDAPERDQEVNGDDIEGGDASPTSSRRSSVPKTTKDPLPTQWDADNPDSHSVFDQLVLDEDPMDGSRVLRKRKSSSFEAEDIEPDGMSLRKRRKNASNGSGSVQDGSAKNEKTNGGVEGSVRSRSARSLRQKTSSSGTPSVLIKKSRSSLIVKMRVDPTELRGVLAQKPRATRKRRTATSRSSRTGASSSAAARGSAAAAAELLTTTPAFSSSYSQPFYSFYDKEPDELKGKPYGGILTEEQADTTKTLPTKDDRRRFDEAKQKAEEEWRNRLLAMQAEAEPHPVRRSKKSSGPASQIERIEMGGWEIDTWYAAPYPEEYSRNSVLYICEFCLKYMNSDYVAWRHKLKCPAKHPPGDEIYRHGSISFFEVDGRKNPVYCQNLCLLAKLFLGSKTLYYDVEPFLFYVLCEYDDLGYHFVGYFSKEKRASSQNNVSCILTLPIHQRKGYGNLLIDFSYLLTRVEEKTGSPEKPLSDMGLVSYRNYWRLIISRYLINALPDDKSQKQGLSIRKISDDTGMVPDDVISALEGLRCLVRDHVSGLYAFRVDLAYCRQYVEKWEAKNYVSLNPKVLTWTPYVMGRSNATNFELGPALNTIAPREEDEDTKAVHALAESGIATGDFAISQVSQKSALESEPAVLESTEPNDSTDIEHARAAPPNGIGNENGDAHGNTRVGTSLAHTTDGAVDDNDWLKVYNDLPPTRFQVFPPANPRRPGPQRMGSSITRPSLPRGPSSASRPRPKPKSRRSTTGGSARKLAPKKSSSSNNSARRKTGGTGRGPGRWPKGTKKSDYGNADSGPGLPPGWKRKADGLGTPIPPGEEDDEEVPGNEDGMMDTVNVQVNNDSSSSLNSVSVPRHPQQQKGKGKQSDTISARFEVVKAEEHAPPPPNDATTMAGESSTSSSAKMVAGPSGGGAGDAAAAAAVSTGQDHPPDVIMGEGEEDAEGDDE